MASICTGFGGEEIFKFEVSDVLWLNLVGLDIGVDLVLLLVLTCLGVGWLGLFLELDVVGNCIVDCVVCSLVLLILVEDDKRFGEKHHGDAD